MSGGRQARGVGLTDVLLSVLVLALLSITPVAGRGALGPHAAAVVPLLLASWTPLLLRHRYPVVVLALVVAVECIRLTALPLVAPVQFTSAPVAVMLAAYEVGKRRSRRIAWPAAGAAAVLVLVVGLVVRSSDEGRAANSFALDLVLLSAAAGVTVRSRYSRLAEMEQRAELAEQTREAEARRRVAVERLRMARDLHDVVAHHLTLVDAQAGIAEYLLRTDQQAAAQALHGIAEHTRQALDELRATVGLLRDADASTDPDATTDGAALAAGAYVEGLRPVPGLAALPALVEDHRLQGVEISSHVLGDPGCLPALGDLAAYRIVQESVTNARKHAPGASVDVDVTWTDDILRLDVSNGRSDATAPGTGTGHGLIGMRERAAAAGGTLDAGPRPDGGYLVRAVLPLLPRPGAHAEEVTEQS